MMKLMLDLIVKFIILRKFILFSGRQIEHYIQFHTTQVEATCFVIEGLRKDLLTTVDGFEKAELK